MKHLNRFTLPLVLTTGMFTVMTGTIIVPVLNVMRESLSVDAAGAALIVTTHSIFIAVLSPLVGAMIDRVGIRKPFFIALLFYGAAGGSGLVIESYWLLLASRAVLGTAAAVVFISDTVLILNQFTDERRNQVIGWQGGVNAFSAVVWPMIGGALGALSWHLPFAVHLIAVPLAALALFSIPEAHRQEKGDTKNQMTVWKIIRSTKVLLAIYGLMFITMVLLYTLSVYGPPFLEEIGITNPFHIGIFIAVLGIALGFTSLMYYRIKRHLSYRMIILLSAALWTAGLFILSQARDSALIVCSIALFGIGQGMVFPMYLVWIGEVSPRAFRGRVSSYLSSFCFLGQFAAPVIFAPVLMAVGPRGVFLAAGFLSLALLAVVAVIGRKNS